VIPAPGREKIGETRQSVLSALPFSLCPGSPCPGRAAARSDAAQSRDPASSVWVPALRRTAKTRCDASGTRSSAIELVGQIGPTRVGFFDQLDFPGTTPTFQRMFSRAGFKNGIERLEIDQQVDTVFPCEAGNELGLMLSHAPRQIIGDADIERSVSLAGEDVDEERAVHGDQTRISRLGTVSQFRTAYL
jgi:hypothetical protein